MKKALAVSLLAAMTLAAHAEEKNLVEIASQDKRFSTLVTALTSADLVETVKNGTFTIFAPTDEAFGKLPKGTVSDLLKPENKDKLIAILTYHVLPGDDSNLAKLLSKKSSKTVQGQSLDVRFEDGRIRVGEASLEASDITAENGIIHVIDSVLLPPPVGPGTIVQTARNSGNFNTLVAAVEAAGLQEALSGEGPFTVFAPTDEAFGRIPKKTLEDLLKPENKNKLLDILKYHVVSGRLTAGDALNRGSVKTLNGQDLDITFSDGEVKVQWATVRAIDLESSNGIIHVIDRVMLPPGKNDVSKTKNAAELIETAIDQGVPAFNNGDHAKCADIYMTASKDLLKRKDISKHMRGLLEKAIRKASHSSCTTTQSWTLRHGLDGAYALLQHADQ